MLWCAGTREAIRARSDQSTTFDGAAAPFILVRTLSKLSVRVAPRLAPRAETVRDIIEAMASWRDSASRQAQDDLDGLLNMTLPFAQQMLAKGGEFGATVTTSGQTRLLAGDLGQERPASADVLSLLVDGLRQERARFRAVAICSDVRLPESDAVRVELEHRDGHAMALLMPYNKKRFGRAVEYDDLRGGPADKQIWV